MQLIGICLFISLSFCTCMIYANREFGKLYKAILTSPRILGRDPVEHWQQVYWDTSWHYRGVLNRGYFLYSQSHHIKLSSTFTTCYILLLLSYRFCISKYGTSSAKPVITTLLAREYMKHPLITASKKETWKITLPCFTALRTGCCVWADLL